MVLVFDLISLSWALNSRAGFLPPIPVVYSSHVSYKVIGCGERASKLGAHGIDLIGLAGLHQIHLIIAFKV